MRKFYFFLILIFSVGLFSLYSESEGEKLFKSNDASGAVVLLENEIRNGEISSDTYNYLGLAYFQLGNYSKSIDAFERGMKSSVSNRKQLCFNEGNVAFTNGDYSKAESCFSTALAVAQDLYPAVLNRANSRLMLKKYSDAILDYKRYIEAVPDDVQKDKIIQLIGYLQEQLVFEEQEKQRLAEEQRILEEENARMQQELARQAAEKAAKEAEEKASEEERRRKLLEDVANSLQQTETTNMTAGAEEVLDYDYESELD